MNIVKIYYADCIRMVHFEIDCTQETMNDIQNYLDWVDVWSDELNTTIDCNELIKLGATRVEVTKYEPEKEFNVREVFADNLIDILESIEF